MMSTEFVSNEHSLLVNSCGVNRVFEKKRGSVRPEGRRDYHMLYIAEGTCHAYINGAWCAAKKGSMLFYYPGERQEYYFDPKDRSVSYYVHFTGRDCEQKLNSLDLRRSPLFDIGKSVEVEHIFEKMILEHSLKQMAYEEYTAALLLRLLVTVARKKALVENKLQGEYSRYIQHALLYMYNHLQKSPSVKEISHEIGLCEGYFSHLFSAVMGMSPYAYMMTLRIEKAKDLLLNTDRFVSEIYADVGFVDQSHFSHFFKKKVGMSPSEYRKMK